MRDRPSSQLARSRGPGRLAHWRVRTDWGQGRRYRSPHLRARGREGSARRGARLANREGSGSGLRDRVCRPGDRAPKRDSGRVAALCGQAVTGRVGSDKPESTTRRETSQSQRERSGWIRSRDPRIASERPDLDEAVRLKHEVVHRGLSVVALAMRHIDVVDDPAWFRCTEYSRSATNDGALMEPRDCNRVRG
jgi:hypothetical protein